MKSSKKSRRRNAPPKTAAPTSPNAASADDVQPLFEPELLAAAHALPELADTTVIGHDAPATDNAGTDTHALAKFNELAHGTSSLEVLDHEHALATVPGEHVDTHVGTPESVGPHERADHRGQPTELVIDERGPRVEPPQPLEPSQHLEPLQHREPPHHVLTASGSAYDPGTERPVDPAVEKAVAHERDALADAHRVVEIFGGEREREPAANKRLAAEKAREGDPTIDRHASGRAVDAAYAHEVLAKAKEIEHQLEDHLESEALDRAAARRQPSVGDSERAEMASDRAHIAEVEPVPTTNAELHRERVLFVGGAAWVVGGLAGVVLGILALARIGRPLVLLEVAFLATAVSILASSIANGARVGVHARARREDDARDVDDALAQPPHALHGRGSEQRRDVELHR